MVHDYAVVEHSSKFAIVGFNASSEIAFCFALALCGGLILPLGLCQDIVWEVALQNRIDEA